jgi:Na+-translocating ferredoxin:NAD+ oxidoreductase RnfC subunit
MFSSVGASDVRGSAYCCECNLCSMWSCPEDLDPKGVCSQNKRRLMADGTKWVNPPFNPQRPLLHMANRKAPTRRLLQKLGLMGFQNTGPLVESLLATAKVGIALKQHVGAPCEATVAAGAKVKAGQEVGRPPVKDGKPALGAPVHASIDGTVTSVEGGVVWIQK